eukprot:COSAG02_NODE_2467_length_8767_cov_226.095870_6_plen_203_part_00
MSGKTRQRLISQPAWSASLITNTLIDCSDDHLSVPVARRSGAPICNNKQERASCQSRAPICNIEKTSPVSGPSPDTIPLTDWSIDAQMRLAARAARMSLTSSLFSPGKPQSNQCISTPEKKRRPDRQICETGTLRLRREFLRLLAGSVLFRSACPPIPPTALANRTASLTSIPPIHSTTRQSVTHLTRSLLVIHFSFSCSRY